MAQANKKLYIKCEQLEHCLTETDKERKAWEDLAKESIELNALALEYISRIDKTA